MHQVNDWCSGEVFYFAILSFFRRRFLLMVGRETT
jgi:hypothetical protein